MGPKYTAEKNLLLKDGLCAGRSKSPASQFALDKRRHLWREQVCLSGALTSEPGAWVESDCVNYVASRRIISLGLGSLK